MSPVIACDCDLGRISAWCSVCGPVCNQAPDAETIYSHVFTHARAKQAPLMIFEIAAPTSVVGEHRVGGNAKLYHLARWMLFNVHMATAIDAMLGVTDVMFHVAPSSVWTKGFSEVVRQKMAQVIMKYPGTKKPVGHDMRECQAMLWFHSRNPKAWIPLRDFIGALKGK